MNLKEGLIKLPEHLVKELRIGRDTCKIIIYQGEGGHEDKIMCDYHNQRTIDGCRTRDYYHNGVHINGCTLRNTDYGYQKRESLFEKQGIIVYKEGS